MLIGRHRSPGSIALVLSLGLPAAAYAQLGPNGSPINSSQYSVDLFQGPVTTSTRVIGLGGAYEPIAESSEGNFVNPAAAAIRLPWSYTHLDYDVGLGVALPSTLKQSDFFNSGSDRTNLGTTNQYDFVFLDAEGDVQLGPWAFGTAWTLQQYALSRSANSESEAANQQVRALFVIGLVHVARTFAHGQFLVGAGVRYTALNVLNLNTASYNNQTLFTTQGAGLQFGWLWRPHDQNFRIGAAVRSAVTTGAESGSNILTDANGNRVLFPNTADQMYLPSKVSLPWEYSLGFAVQFGTREFNPRWVDPSDIAEGIRAEIKENESARQFREAQLRQEFPEPGSEAAQRRRAEFESIQQEREADNRRLHEIDTHVRAIVKVRERALKRWYLLTATSLKVSGPVDNAVGIESFLQRVADRSGSTVVASPHLGIESEVVPRWIKLRAGVYGEPTRFTNGKAAPRVHTTAGFETKLLRWSVFGLWDKDNQWRIQASVDSAQRYFSWSLSIGVWR